MGVLLNDSTKDILNNIIKVNLTTKTLYLTIN